MRHGRKRPYTTIGIARVPCVRCGRKPSVHQWQVCADSNLYRPPCLDCDIALNRLALEWSNDPEAGAKAAAYEASERSR